MLVKYCTVVCVFYYQRNSQKNLLKGRVQCFFNAGCNKQVFSPKP